MNIKLFFGGSVLILFGITLFIYTYKVRNEGKFGFGKMNLFKAFVLFIVCFLGGFLIIAESMPNCHILHAILQYILG
jgi:hypothetical protein